MNLLEIGVESGQQMFCGCKQVAPNGQRPPIQGPYDCLPFEQVLAENQKFFSFFILKFVKNFKFFFQSKNFKTKKQFFFLNRKKLKEK